MAPEAFPELSDLDLKQLSALIEQRSVTWDEQIATILLVRDLFEERRNQVSLRGLSLLMSGLDQASRVGRSESNVAPVFVIGRGDHTAEETSRTTRPLNVLIPAHVDTVKATDALFAMNHDAAEPDRAIGRGIYDMKGAVLNSLELATTIKVPLGMNVYFAFLIDEEKHSRGVRALMQQWPMWNQIDVVLSSEIGHVEVPPDDLAMRYILGRRGRQKHKVSLSVDPDGRGHFADGHVRSASAALMQALHTVWERFYHGGSHMNAQPRLQLPHPLFDEETLEIGAVSSADPGQSLSLAPTSADAYFNILSVPPRTIEQGLLEQQQLFAEINATQAWQRHRIAYTIGPNPYETSYPAFVMPDTHPLAELTRKILTRVAGVPAVPAYAKSVADENLLAAAMQHSRDGQAFGVPHMGVISIPPLGGNAHRPDEWGSLHDIARVRHAFHLLIEDPEGLQKLISLKNRIS